jgi:hypothetical protein
MASLELAPIDEMPETESLIREPVSLMPGERGQRRAGVPATPGPWMHRNPETRAGGRRTTLELTPIAGCPQAGR